MDTVTIFRARKILTMNPLQPEAEVVAVSGGKIYAVGREKNIVNGLKVGHIQYTVDDQFKDNVIIPGFIETHCHPFAAGIMWKWLYVGCDTRKDTTGRLQPGCKTHEEVLERLIEYEKTLAPNEPLIAWGYDPALLESEGLQLRAVDLDRVSGERLVIVLNMSGHLFYVNSATLIQSNITNKTDIPGVVKDGGGEPTGELHELHAIGVVIQRYFKFDEKLLTSALYDVAGLAQSTGCTTIADLAIELIPGTWPVMQNVTLNHDFPVRLSGYVFNEYLKQKGELEELKRMMAVVNEKLHINGVKFFTDGSIQGYTANMEWPYYYDGTPNGLQNMDQKSLAEQLRAYHNAGIQCAAHANGTAGIAEWLEALEAILFENPKMDHRHRIEHCQTITNAQLDSVAKLGLCISFFANHIYYWGDFHKTHTLGPDRASYMNPLASSADRNIHFALHSDAHTTPIDPLFSIWVGATRQTRSGDVLGINERISVMQGLKAMTYDGAYILHEEHIKGSIEPAKLADFTVLDEDPLTVKIDDIKNIKVVATVLGGMPIKVKI